MLKCEDCRLGEVAGNDTVTYVVDMIDDIYQNWGGNGLKDLVKD